MPAIASSLRLALSIVTGALVLGGTSNAYAACGDQLHDATETCDDGNLNSGDGCSATCQVEPGYSCAKPDQIQNGSFEQGFTGFWSAYSIDTGTQTEAVCGGQRRRPMLNRIIVGNSSMMCSGFGGSGNYLQVDGAGTSTVTQGTWNPGDTNVIWRHSVTGPGKRFAFRFAYVLRRGDATTADGVLDFVLNGSRLWRVETGQSAAGSPANSWRTHYMVINLPTWAPVSTLEFRQANGNYRPSISLDAISFTGASVCSQLCGNGVLDPGEACDDGNTTKGDGCYSCRVGVGYSCSGQPSVCVSATLQSAPAN